MPASAEEKRRAVQIGPVRLDERIDPADPTEVGELAGKVDSASDALTIINENRRRHEEIGPLLALPPDVAASETLDLDEVEKVAGVTVEGASVRGRDNTAKVVIYTTRIGDPLWGRSTKGMLPYDDKLSKSQAAYEDRLAREEDAVEAAEAVRGAPRRLTGADPSTIQLQQQLARQAEQLEALERRLEARGGVKRDEPEQTAADDDGTGDKLKKGQERPDHPGHVEAAKRQNPNQPSAADKGTGDDEDEVEHPGRVKPPKRDEPEQPSAEDETSGDASAGTRKRSGTRRSSGSSRQKS